MKTADAPASPAGIAWRDARLTVPAEFARVFSLSERARIDAYLVMARPNTQGHPRLGLVVAKKLARRAVQRNRIKRCAREAFRAVRAELPACDFVVRLIGIPPPGHEAEGLASAFQRAARRARAKWPDAFPPTDPGT